VGVLEEDDTGGAEPKRRPGAGARGGRCRQREEAMNGRERQR
jgi:hypothetical protein